MENIPIVVSEGKSSRMLNNTKVTRLMYFPMLCVFAGIGWRAEVLPRTHPVNELEFDVIIGADGRRNTLAGRKQQSNRCD